MTPAPAVLLAALVAAAPATPAPATQPQVVMHTELGDVRLEIYADRAPVTAANFLTYVDRGLYKDASFYRTVTPDNQPGQAVKIEVIQGGLGWEEQPGALPPIAHENTARTGVHHLDGTLSMARDRPGSATSEFFICIGDQPELDFGGHRNADGRGFAAFGRVVAGMDVVRAIQRRPADGQRLTPPVRIVSIERLPAPAPMPAPKPAPAPTP
jgi:peptidyl-prolyl cis-trans isomerase A (cyclophilin A)